MSAWEALVALLCTIALVIAMALMGPGEGEEMRRHGEWVHGLEERGAWVIQ
jgi:hypothetical protein